MNKLLLLATTLISLSIRGNARDANQYQYPDSTSKLVYNDSITKKIAEKDPKNGFKNLFQTETTTSGVALSKLNPQAVSFVQDYIEKNTAHLNKLKSSGRPYFDMIDAVLTRHGIPKELKYLSVIESDLKTSAVSWAGAVGPWQFMAETARFMGLKVNRYSDERTDFYKSTHAAARYLTHLYGMYNDWLLVIAAYNGGPGNVNSAIRKSGSRSFWSLQNYLPAESRIHVKKFIATHYIMEGSGGSTTLTKSERENLVLNEPVVSATNSGNTNQTTSVTVSGKYNSFAIASGIQMDIAEFIRLNPGFDKQLSATGSYNMKLPNDKLIVFQANKPQILEQSIKLMLTMAGK